MPVIKKPNLHFDATLYTGTGATQSIVNSGAMQPDLVWLKARSTTTNHRLYDSVRGATLQIQSNTTDAQAVNANGLTAFGSNGFTVGSASSENASGQTFVGWQWKAGGAAVTNTSGTISSQVSANPTAGFSVVTYTGNGSSSATVGHGLGVAPGMIIVKSRSATTSWFIWHSSLTAGYQLRFTTDAQEQVSSATTDGGLGSGTSSVINFIAGSVDTDNVNASGGTFVAYCFAPIAGYSAFGSYTGNGSTDGPFVFTNFKPRFIMAKPSSTTGEWTMWDSSRDTYNVGDKRLVANDFASEYNNGNGLIDFLSNGFKPRVNHISNNSSGVTYIYMAFAESPFKYSNAR
jgi:hypothetical protein